MTKRIIFRADGNSINGLGHLYRLFSLVEIVKTKWDFVFITHETSTDSVISNQYEKVIIPKAVGIKNEPQWLADNFPSDEFIVIADGYQFTATYQKQLKVKGYSLIYVDDLAKEHMYADIVINHSPFIKENHYTKEAYTDLALGTQYALLRPRFLKEAKKNRVINSVDNAFVCFGGADPHDLTFEAVKALVDIKAFQTINIVLGGAYKHRRIFNLKQNCSDKINIYKNLSEKNLLEVMKASNFAIAPASTILYELCCVKMPIFSGFYVDNQELIYKGFKENNVIYKGGDLRDYKANDFTKQINDILEENKFGHKIQAQKRLFDNKIAQRHLNLIMSLC